MSSLHPLEQLLRERIAIIDGAMGTMVQLYRQRARFPLDEAQFRGERFANWNGKDLCGNNELLLLTAPRSSRRFTSNTSRRARISSRQIPSVPRRLGSMISFFAKRQWDGRTRSSSIG
jgi:hypothetical protein